MQTLEIKPDIIKATTFGPKFEVNANKMVEVLTVLNSIVHPKESEMVKRQVMIEIRDKLTLTTVNESTLLKATLDAKIGCTGPAMCVDIQNLINLLSKFNGDINFDNPYDDDDYVLIRAGRSSYKFPLFPNDEFETLTKYEDFEGDFSEIEVSSFRDALDCVYTSSSKDSEILSSAFIGHDLAENEHCVVCSNSELGAAVIKETLSAFPQGPIPKFIVDFILKLKDVRMLEYKEKDGLFRGKVGCFEFAYRSPDIEYPWGEIKAFLEGQRACTKIFKIDKADMSKALSRISLITDNDTHAVTLNFKNNSVIINAEGPGSHGREEIPLLENVGEPGYEVTMDSIYLFNVLKEFEGNVEWTCDSPEGIQFISDGYLTKFFIGLA